MKPFEPDYNSFKHLQKPYEFLGLGFLDDLAAARAYLVCICMLLNEAGELHISSASRLPGPWGFGFLGSFKGIYYMNGYSQRSFGRGPNTEEFAAILAQGEWQVRKRTWREC